MNRRERVAEFLEYGGSELFSQIMSGCGERAEGIERLIRVLKSYSDLCGFIKGRSAAYRFMIRSAGRRGWLGKGCGDLGSHILTDDEHKYISCELSEYISSGGRAAAVLKKLLRAVVYAAITALLIYLLIRYFNSEEFKRISGSYPF